MNKENLDWTTRIWWYGEYKNIGKHILITVHSAIKDPIWNVDLPKAISQTFEVNLLVVEYLYSFLDNHGSHFDHCIRNGRTALFKKKELIGIEKENSQPFVLSNELSEEKIQYSTKTANKFINSIKNGFSLNNIKGQSQFDAQAIYASILEESKRGKKEIFEERIAVEELEICLRREFSRQMNLIIENRNSLEYTSIEGKEFPKPQFAHIFPVANALKNKKYWNSIHDSTNGLILEPNIHVLFDANLIKLKTNGDFIDEKGKLLFVLRAEELKRINKKWIELRNEKCDDLKIGKESSENI